MTSAKRSRVSPAGVVNSGVVFLVLLVILPLVLSVSQPAPPAIAEFSPNAQQIKQAPQEQTSDFGSGDNGAGTGPGQTPSPTPPPAVGSVSPSPKPIERGRVRKCVGNPPRQIEDPQSPPCVPYFEGDNGGATSMGVTATEILVANPGGAMDRIVPIVNFINKRFELYGRKIRIVDVVPEGSAGAADGAPDPPAEQATADKVAALKPFASLGIYSRDAGEIVYYDALARHKILSVSLRPTWVDEAHLRKFAPYEWSYLPGGSDVGGRALAEYVCHQLKGRDAEYAGSGVSGPRVFGLVTSNSSGFKPDTSYFKTVMSGCGVPIAVEKEYIDVCNTCVDPSTQNQGASIIAAMMTAKVTSILCLCKQGNVIGMMLSAESQVYHPEWVTTTYHYNDQDAAGTAEPAPQRGQQFGVSFRPKPLPVKDHPSTWAVEEGDPTVHVGTGTDAYATTAFAYPQLLLLASGIQMAGPNLTPETFEAGLFKTVFPNPGAGAAPYYQAHVGFSGGKHTMTDDANVYWWGEGQPSRYAANAPGAFCYALRGKRFGVGEWPDADLPLFQGSCY